MASEIQDLLGAVSSALLWPPDDTEESVVGTDWHQMTIINLRWGSNEIAHQLQEPEQPLPWQALSQTMVTGFQRPDGSRYRTLPDVFIYLHPIEQSRGSVAIGVDGPPALIIEVLSESTYEVDLDMEGGKGFSYARAGVREYLALDPTGAFIEEKGRGWRLVDGVYRAWEPDAMGRWQSESITAAYGPEGNLASVYTRDGERQLREGEVGSERARRRELEEELAALRRLVEKQQL